MNIGQEIKRLRLEKGMTLEQLGDKCGVGKSTVRKWENGIIKDMKRDKISKLAEALNVSPSYFFECDTDKKKSSDGIKIVNIFPIEVHKLPMLGEISCGNPTFANEDRESYVDAGTGIKADFCLKAKGNSMVNARIHDGDIVFIRRQDIVENGEIAAVVVNNDNEATLKRFYYYRERATLILKPENPEYEDLIFQNEELNEVQVLGKAIAFQSDVK